MELDSQPSAAKPLAFAMAVATRIPSIALDEDRRLVEATESQDGTSLALAFRSALGGDLAVSLQHFRACLREAPTELKAAYYVVAASFAAGVHPDTYLKEIEFHEESGGDLVASRLLRAIELVHRGLLNEMVGFLVGGVEAIDRNPVARAIAVRVFHWSLGALQDKNDHGFTLDYLAGIGRSSLSDKRLRDVALAGMLHGTFNEPWLSAAIARFLFAFGSTAACEAFLVKHAHLLCTGPMTQEALSLPTGGGGATCLPKMLIAWLASEDEFLRIDRHHAELFAIRAKATQGVEANDRWGLAGEIAQLQSKRGLSAGRTNAVCIFGQLRDLDAFERLKKELGDGFQADIFVATWDAVGSRQIDPVGRLNFLEELIPKEFKRWFSGLGLRDFPDLKRRLPALYDLVTMEHTTPIERAAVMRDARGRLRDLHLASPKEFEDDIQRISRGVFSQRHLHIQNQIRMWYLINKALELKRHREDLQGELYRRVLLVRSDLSFAEGSIETLKQQTEQMREGEIAFDFDPFAWTIGGIGDRYIAGSSPDIDVFMAPWQAAEDLFSETGKNGAIFLRDLAPHRLARNIVFAAGLYFRPVGSNEVGFHISRKNSHFDARLREMIASYGANPE